MPEFNPYCPLTTRGKRSWPRFSLWFAAPWMTGREGNSLGNGPRFHLPSSAKEKQQMGQGKEPGLWGEMGFGSLPAVTRAVGYATGSPQQKHRGSWGGRGLSAVRRTPDSWARSTVCSLPHPTTCLTSPVKWDTPPPPRELQD